MTRRRLARKLKTRVRERAQGYCEDCICWEHYATARFSTEHIIAIAAGGGDDEDNLALACQGCNGAKHDNISALDPTTEQSVPLYHPRHDDWYAHFRWNADYTLLIGVTPIGRATVAALDLNREGVINLRQVMTLAGKHPPAQRASSQ